jgi:hypothetical protein
MTGASMAVETKGFAEVCRVKCLNPALLGFQPVLHLGVRVKGRAVCFEVWAQGNVAPKGFFAVRYP